MQQAPSSSSSSSVPAPRQQLYLLYHELCRDSTAYSYAMAAERFAEHAGLCARLERDADSLRPRITFDDGHRSDVELALPVLQEHSLQAHFFITVGWTGNKPGYMGWDDLRTLHAAGQRIGAHGWTHTLLTHCTAKELDRELLGSRLELESRLGAAVTTMSLPGGRSNGRVLAACRKAGYTQVYTSQPRAEGDPAAETVGRLNLLGTADTAWLARVLRPETGVLRRLGLQDRSKTMAKQLLGDRLYGRLWGMVNHAGARAAGDPA